MPSQEVNIKQQSRKAKKSNYKTNKQVLEIQKKNGS